MSHALPGHAMATVLIKPVLSRLSKNHQKRVYQVDNQTKKDHPKGFYKTFEQEEKKSAYLSKCFNEIFINFVGIEVVYSKCHSSFFSKLKLHRHIKSECIGETLPFSFF